MSIHETLRTRAGVSQSDRDERARRAVQVFREMMFSLTGYARAITGRKNIRIVMSTGAPRTDGTTIWYQPPIALGDNTPHDRRVCDKRDGNKLLVCPACAIREEVLINIYHEIGHITFGSFDQTTVEDKRFALDQAIREWGGKYEQRIRAKLENAPHHIKSSYQGLSGIVNPYLPMLLNSIDDARVDSSMFRARPGIKTMMQASTYDIFTRGIETPDGSRKLWADAPLDSQAMIACYLYGVDMPGWREWLDASVVEAFADEQLVKLLKVIPSMRTMADVYRRTFPIMARLRELGYFKVPEDTDDNESEDGNDGDREPGDSDGETQESGGMGGSPGSSAGSPPGGSDSGASDSGADQGALSDAPESANGSVGGDPEGSQLEALGSQEGQEDRGQAGPSGASEGSGDSDDSAPEPAGQHGEPEEQEFVDGTADDTGDEADPTAEGAGGASDEANEDSEGRGDESEDGEADGLGGTAGDPAEEQSLPGAPGADDERDERSADAVQEEGQASDAAERDGDSGQPEPGDPDGDSSEELIDTGADRGEGGTKGGGYHGTPEEAAEFLGVFHPHEVGLHADPEATAEDQRAVQVAIVQGEYFEKPSANVTGVRVHEFDNPLVDEDGRPIASAWTGHLQDRLGLTDKRVGRGLDLDVPESIMGPALLRTRRTFSDNETADYQRNLRSGRVNGASLGKRAWNNDDRLFQKKRLPGKRNYKVLIGIDVSGSTIGVNIALAKKAAWAQAELCARTGVDFAVYAHSASGEGRFWYNELTLDIYVIKEFSEPWDPTRQLRLRELSSASENLDGHTLEFYRKVLDKEQATDKVILYYTDGKMPAANYDEELDVLQQEIKTCKKKGYTLMGVGIRTDSPRCHGLDTVQVDDETDVGKVIDHLDRRLRSAAR